MTVESEARQVPKCGFSDVSELFDIETMDGVRTYVYCMVTETAVETTG
ncbi:hypothetical protein BH23CHL2_BH23CHL2_05920 [soil metagenome]